MVRGRLQVKKGYYYAILSYRIAKTKTKEIWRATGVKTTEDRRKAQRICEGYKEKLIIELNMFSNGNELLQYRDRVLLRKGRDILFGDYLIRWLDLTKNHIEKSTFSSYQYTINSKIKSYFNKLKISLVDLTARDISFFYYECLKNISASTLKHYHVIIRQALQYAYQNELVISNVAVKVKIPKVPIYVGTYYNQEELLNLFNCVKGKQIEFAVLMASYYGLRRSEIVGLKWSNIDFQYKTIIIKHTVVDCVIDGKSKLLAKDRAKSQSSIRTLPLLPNIEEYLIRLKELQLRNKEIYGDSYNQSYLDYVYVNQIGELIRPGFITQNFPIVLRNNNLRRIRFHDLRHSLAALLRHNGAKMEDIQKWLGHSTIEITEKIYSHFENIEYQKLATIIQDALRQ